MEIIKESFRLQKGGNTIATFGVRKEKLKDGQSEGEEFIYGFSLVRKKDGGEFIGYPSKSYEKDGQKKFVRTYYLTGELDRRFQTKVKELLVPFIREGDTPQNTATDNEVLPF